MHCAYTNSHGGAVYCMFYTICFTEETSPLSADGVLIQNLA